MNKKNKESVKNAIESVFPIVLGFLPIAMAFGILSKNTGLSFNETSLFSIMVYAGASQFMALDLIQGGLGVGGIILATFLLNSRHLIMSASLSTKLKNIKRSYLPLVAFGITDEGFSLFSFTKHELNLVFILVVNILSYLSWVVGTMLGYIVGEVLPQSLQASLGIGLYGMFAALLFPQFKGNRKNILLSIVSAIIYVLLFYSKLFSEGWDIIMAILLSSIIGVIIFNKNLGEDVN